ncbi:sodium:alanine symporter family protein [Fulvimarina endophytica]|uniref:Sodium:alanine symporter family protein n=1 Tax=Fulvimarina endophytica TaxID=2293836 RepID=A0A371X9W4_9HYPH|nr:sodium:alanine symporter family protein [Fulvimarina endophytica]RFC66027.1 sodium:alanine symporter family protein [Fulvimarina endophytica]
MAAFESFLNTISGIIWGPITLVLLLGTGLYLTIGLRALPWRRIGTGFSLLWSGRATDASAKGEITPFQALSTALAATIGTGNIAGVATAITLGGPGAIFWMWVTALVGMATKYAEAVLAVHYRRVDENGNYLGGPMVYIRDGLGEKWAWLAFLFALFATVAAFGIGNTVQANSVADAMQTSFGVPVWITGLVLAVLVGAVVLGGIKRIGRVAETLVPLMAAVYVLGALAIILIHINQLPGAFAMIFTDAFTGTAATGGFAGAGVLAAIRYGVARGVFSNEAGLGSAPIAHAAAQTKNPYRQGLVAMLGTFIDTIIVCTMTALVIIMSGLWTSGQTGAGLSASAFTQQLPGPGGWLVTFGLIVFAFTTLLGWSYYGERTATYIFGPKVVLPFRVVWVVAVFVGAIGQLGIVWLIADVMNGLMALPNLVGLVLLSPVVFKLTKEAVAKGR